MGRSQMRALLHTHQQARAGADSEYGSLRDVERVFGLRETKTYDLFNQGLIRGVLLRKDKMSPRGKRLFSFQSIREYLASLESTGDAAPKSDAARKGRYRPTGEGRGTRRLQGQLRIEAESPRSFISQSTAAMTSTKEPSLAEAKKRVRIADLWRDFGFEGEPRKVCRCQFHEDKSPSFSVFLTMAGVGKTMQAVAKEPSSISS